MLQMLQKVIQKKGDEIIDYAIMFGFDVDTIYLQLKSYLCNNNFSKFVILDTD